MAERRCSAALALAACMLCGLVHSGASDQSLEFTFQTKLYTELRQSPCTRLLTADSRDVGCSCACPVCWTLNARPEHCRAPTCSVHQR